jgi:hypothetical protein
VGSVLGGLIDVFTIEDGIIAYDFFKEGNGKENDDQCTFSFHKEIDESKKERYVFANQSYDTNAVISFPAKGPDSGEVIVVPGGGRLPLNGIFNVHAKNDNSSFDVSADGLKPGTGASSTAVQSICSKYGLDINSTLQGIGSFMSVKSDGKSLTLKPVQSVAITGVENIQVDSNSDTGFKALQAGAPQEDGTWLWTFPQPIKDAINVSVIASISISTSSIKADGLTKLTDDELARLKKAKRLNW